MNKFLVPVLAILPIAMCAQNAEGELENDSTKVTDLTEFVVEGRTQQVIKNGVEYIPSKRMKKSSVDATQLLVNLQAPQLRIAPGSKDVKTNTGQHVAFFINYQKATPEELSGMHTEDVVRVEVLRYPEDARFLGEINVVNFIVHEYEYGGFTKATLVGQSLDQDVLIGMLYSKFSYKNWKFNASTTDGGGRFKKQPYYSDEQFHDIDFNGKHYDDLTRVVNSGEGFLRKVNLEKVNFKADWHNNKNFMTAHIFNFDRLAGRPLYRRTDRISYSDANLPVDLSTYRENLQTINYSAEGDYTFFLPKDFSLYAQWNFGYASNRRDSRVVMEYLPEIVNDSREKAYTYRGEIQVNKRFGHDNQLSFKAITSNTNYNTNYIRPSDDVQKLLSSTTVAWFTYTQNWKNGMNLYTRTGMAYTLGRVNGERVLSRVAPRMGLQLAYPINKNHSVSVNGWWFNDSPTVDYFSDAFVQSHELLWLKGNPGLKMQTGTQDEISYTFIPTNTLNMTLGFTYYLEHNKANAVYTVLPGYDGVIRNMVSGGDFNKYSIDFSVSKSLLQNSLRLSAYGSAYWINMTGINSLKRFFYYTQVNASYSIGHFLINGSYIPPMTWTDAYALGAVWRSESRYALTLTYNVGDFIASVEAINIFNRGKNMHTTFVSDRYSKTVNEWVENFGRKIELTLSYTIPYGKKVSRQEEVGGAETIKSAVLK